MNICLELISDITKDVECDFVLMRFSCICRLFPVSFQTQISRISNMLVQDIIHLYRHLIITVTWEKYHEFCIWPTDDWIWANTYRYRCCDGIWRAIVVPGKIFLCQVLRQAFQVSFALPTYAFFAARAHFAWCAFSAVRMRQRYLEVERRCVVESWWAGRFWPRNVGTTVKKTDSSLL